MTISTPGLVWYLLLINNLRIESNLRFRLQTYLIKIELRHDSLKWVCDARDILTQNVLEKDGYHNYHRAGFHFDLLNFL